MRGNQHIVAANRLATLFQVCAQPTVLHVGIVAQR